MRLFIAIPLPETARGRLAALCEGLRVGRWIQPANFHITLKFLGEVDRPRAEDLDEALEAIRAPAFDVTFEGLGTFERKGRVHTLWVGIDRSEALKRLRDKVERACQQLGFEPEGGRFTPHISLARFKTAPPPSDIGAWLERSEPFSAGPYPVDRFTLFQSHLAREGAVYDALVEYELTGAGLAAAAAGEDDEPA